MKHLRKAARAWRARAEALDCEARGPVEVESGVWAHALPDGKVEVWHREPTADETRALISTGPITAPARVEAGPKSAAAKRIEKLFGGRK